MFIESEDTIDVTIYFKKKGRHFDVYTEEEWSKATIEDEEKEKYTEVNLEMKPMTWGFYNSLQEEAMIENINSGEKEFNFKVYKENRLLKLLKAWDAKDKNGKPVPINKESVSKLAPSVAEAVITCYDNLAFVDEEEENF